MRFWLAGLLEGDGHFGSNGNSPLIRLAMTDRDVVVRAAKLMGTKVKTRPAQKENRKDIHITLAMGEDAEELMYELHPLMGERKGEMIINALLKYKGKGRKFNRGTVKKTREYYKTSKCSIRRLAEKFGMAYSNAWKIVNHRIWNDERQKKLEGRK